MVTLAVNSTAEFEVLTTVAMKIVVLMALQFKPGHCPSFHSL
jgi:hypothetical protein